MKYMITNGNSYINLKVSGSTVYSLVDAARFKYQDALDFIENYLNADPQWGYRKVYNGRKGKNYVITTGINYVSDSGPDGITTKYEKTKWFRSPADAEAYLAKHKLPFTPVIVDDEGNVIEMSAKKTFTPEQLAILGKSATQKTDRIAMSTSTRVKVYQQGNGICAICGKPVSYEEFTIDHIIPLSRGGGNELNNLQIACKGCNELKNNRTDPELNKGLAAILSHQLTLDPNSDVSDMLIRTIVRSKIAKMYEDVNYNNMITRCVN